MTQLDDVHRLREELQKLHEQKAEVNERLNSWNGPRGRGRGMPPPPMHDMLRSRAHPGGPRRENRLFEAASRPIPSRIGPSDGPHSDRFAERRPAGERVQAPLAVSVPNDPPKKLMSAIVINGQTKMLQKQAEPVEEPETRPPFEGPGTAKRPALSEAERAPDAAKRARRMFGNLLGTLARASAEEKKFQDTGAGQKRQTAMQRVGEREREQRQQARQEAIAREKAQRQAEILRKRELSAMEDVKRSEITAAEALRHQTTLSNFIRTVSCPPLHWLPGNGSLATDALLEREKERLEIWKVEAVEKLEEERRRILAARAPQLLPPEEDDKDDKAVGEDAGQEEGEVTAAGIANGGDTNVQEAGSDRWQAPAGAPEDDRWQQAEEAEGDGVTVSDADAPSTQPSAEASPRAMSLNNDATAAPSQDAPHYTANERQLVATATSFEATSPESETAVGDNEAPDMADVAGTNAAAGSGVAADTEAEVDGDEAAAPESPPDEPQQQSEKAMAALGADGSAKLINAGSESASLQATLEEAELLDTMQK